MSRLPTKLPEVYLNQLWRMAKRSPKAQSLLTQHQQPPLNPISPPKKSLLTSLEPWTKILQKRRENGSKP